MSKTLEDIRELARATGCTRELTDQELKSVHRKLAQDYMDRVMDQEAPDGKKT